jgi:hypothetical protein
LYLFVDAYEPTLGKYMTIPYDLVYDAGGTLNLGPFGVSPLNKLDDQGHVVRSWHFNMSRYVQHVVNGTEAAMDFRLHSPVVVYDYYRPPAVGSQGAATSFLLNPAPAVGRVRLAGNTGPGDTNPQRIRMRIVYSKL